MKLTTKQIQQIQQKRGKILMEKNNIVMVETDASEIAPELKLYTVWVPSEGYVITNTTQKTIAENAFEKYHKIWDTL